MCQQVPGSKSDWGVEQFGGARWSGGLLEGGDFKAGPRQDAEVQSGAWAPSAT